MSILASRAAAIALAALAASWHPAALAQAPQTITPGDNLVLEGIPPIPASVAEQVGRYAEFRSAFLQSWHPRRREMLVRTNFGDTRQIHLVKSPGGARAQLTFFSDNVSQAQFQPVQGRYFIFSKDSGGGEWFQYYRYDLQGGGITLLTDGKSRNTGAVWNRQGTRIAYTSTRRTGKDTDLYTMDPADPKTDKLLAPLEGGGWEPMAWSHDGKQVALLEFISINQSYLWLVDAATGQKKLLTSKGGAEQVFYGQAAFSPGDKQLYVTTDQGAEFSRLMRIDIVTGKREVLTAQIAWDVEAFALSADGRTLAFVTNEDGSSRLHLLDTTTRKHRPVSSLPVGVIDGLAWHDNHRDLGFTLTSARSSGDAYSINATTGALTRWTASETGGIDTEAFAQAQTVRWKSFDGRSISGVLFSPPARFTGKRPVIVSIHGGPEGQARPEFQGINNYLINELGIAIIRPNIRGSTGYGKSFTKLDNGYLREDSYKDIDALLDWIKAQPGLDGNRILVTGGSYGGHMTLATAVNYNDKICCAIDVVGMSNLVTFLENTEGYRRDLRRAEYGDERDPKMREFLQRIAPMTKARNITKPLFVVQGKNDPRVPASEAVQMVTTVRGNGTPVWFLMANDEGHGFGKKKNRNFQFYATVQFIQEYLLNPAAQ